MTNHLSSMNGQFTTKNAKEMGRKGGLKTKRKLGKKYFRELALKRWLSLHTN